MNIYGGLFSEYGKTYIDLISLNSLDKLCTTSIRLSSPSCLNLEQDTGTLVSEWRPRIKKSCPISGLQLGV